MGEVLIGGTASLLICIFLSPKFIEFLRAREFGQQIREEGPQEHHAEIGAYAASAGVELLIAVGPRSTAMLDRFDGEAHAAADAAEAATLARALVKPGDVVLVKASRGVGLEFVAEALAADDDA